jgi:hypothetical protein
VVVCDVVKLVLNLRSIFMQTILGSILEVMSQLQGEYLLVAFALFLFQLPTIIRTFNPSKLLDVIKTDDSDKQKEILDALSIEKIKVYIGQDDISKLTKPQQVELIKDRYSHDRKTLVIFGGIIFILLMFSAISEWVNRQVPEIPLSIETSQFEFFRDGRKEDVKTANAMRGEQFTIIVKTNYPAYVSLWLKVPENDNTPNIKNNMKYIKILSEQLSSNKVIIPKDIKSYGKPTFLIPNKDELPLEKMELMLFLAKDRIGLLEDVSDSLDNISFQQILKNIDKQVIQLPLTINLK